MKVLFLEDVPRVARAGEVKDVSDGYARNFLLPRNLAAPATPAELKRWEGQKQTLARQAARTRQELEALAARIEGLAITLKAKAGEKGQLFGSITTADISQELGRVLGWEVDKRQVETEHLKELGTYDVTVRLTADLTPHVKVTVAPAEA